MQSAHDAGVLSWVTSGRCDLVADIRFPRDESELDLSAIVADIVDKFAESVEKLDKEMGTHLGGNDKGKRIPGQRVLSREALKVPKGWSVEEEKARKRAAALGNEKLLEEEGEEKVEEEKQRVSIDLDIRFKDLKASVPVRPLSPSSI
jgi:distribution and morphology protein 31